MPIRLKGYISHFPENQWFAWKLPEQPASSSCLIFRCFLNSSNRFFMFLLKNVKLAFHIFIILCTFHMSSTLSIISLKKHRSFYPCAFSMAFYTSWPFSIIRTISSNPSLSSSVKRLSTGLSISSTPMISPLRCIGITISDQEAPSQAICPGSCVHFYNYRRISFHSRTAYAFTNIYFNTGGFP